MNKKFYIRTIAFQLLEKIYLQCNHNFTASIDISELINKEITIDMIQKAWKYLMGKQLIEKCDAPYQKWTVTMTAAGVDWIEDCYNVNPTDYTIS